MDLVLAPDDPGDEDVRTVLDTHLAFARDVTPPGHVHALGPDELDDPAVTLFSARLGDRVVGVGALRRIDHGHVELKAMHVVGDARGRGVGRELVHHLLGRARAAGHRRVSLETGTYAAFAPARALYAAAGFRPSPPFGAYTANPHSTCMTRVLDDDVPAPTAVVVVSAATADLTAPRLAEVRALCQDAFDGDFSDDDWAHALGGHHVLALAGGTIVAHAAVVERRLVAETTPLRAGYVEGVASTPSRRRSGLGSAVMRGVRRHLRDHDELGALSTGEHAFYERLGWVRWRGPTYVRTAAGLVRTPDDDDGVMVLPVGPFAGLDPSQQLVCEERVGDDW